MMDAQDTGAKDWNACGWFRTRLGFGLVLGSRGHYVTCARQLSS